MSELNQTAEVLLFSAVWSGSSALIMSMVKKVIKSYDRKVIFREIDVDRHDEIARYYGITKIPVLLFVKDGCVLDSLTGITADSEIIRKINSLFNQNDRKRER